MRFLKACLCPILLVLIGLIFKFTNIQDSVVNQSVQSLMLFYTTLLGIQICSFGGAETFRLICARSTGIKKMKFNLILSLILCFFSAWVVIDVIFKLDFFERLFDLNTLSASGWQFSALLYAAIQCFTVWFSARNQKKLEYCSEFLSLLGIVLGLLAEAFSITDRISIAVETCLLVLFTILITNEKQGLKPNAVILKCFPMGLLRTVLYPAVAIGFLKLASASYEIPLFVNFVIPIGALALSLRRVYYRVDDRTSEVNAFWPAVLGSAAFALAIALYELGLNAETFAVCACVFLLSYAVWMLQYASYRRIWLAVLMLFACFVPAVLPMVMAASFWKPILIGLLCFCFCIPFTFRAVRR